MYKLSPHVKFPLNISKGNVKQRFELADGIMKDFSKNLISELDQKDRISVKSVKKIFKASMPYKDISFSIKTTPKEDLELYDGYITRLERNQKIYKYRIHLPLTNRKTVKKDKTQVTTLIHEFLHMIEMASNPKMISKFSCIDEAVSDPILEFFLNHLYNWENPSKKVLRKSAKKLNKFLKQYDNKTQINILQMYRYDLQGEDNAERAVFKYFTRRKTKKKSFHPLYELKIKLINNKLKEAITAQREALKNNPLCKK